MQTKKLLLASAALIIFSLSIILFQISCRKPATAQSPTPSCIGPQPKLQFKANGTLYVCNAVSDSRLGWVGFPRFYKNIGPSGSNINSFNLNFCNTKRLEKSEDDIGSWVVNFPSTQNTVNAWISFGNNLTSLSVGSYSNNDMGIDFINLNYHYEVNSRSLIFIINSINNGMASGSFSGSLPAGNGLPNSTNDGPLMTITEGVFSDLPILE